MGFLKSIFLPMMLPDVYPAVPRLPVVRLMHYFGINLFRMWSILPADLCKMYIRIAIDYSPRRVTRDTPSLQACREGMIKSDYFPTFPLSSQDVQTGEEAKLGMNSYKREFLVHLMVTFFHLKNKFCLSFFDYISPIVTSRLKKCDYALPG